MVCMFGYAVFVLTMQLWNRPLGDFLPRDAVQQPGRFSVLQCFGGSSDRRISATATQ